MILYNLFNLINYMIVLHFDLKNIIYHNYFMIYYNSYYYNT